MTFFLFSADVYEMENNPAYSCHKEGEFTSREEAEAIGEQLEEASLGRDEFWVLTAVEAAPLL